MSWHAVTPPILLPISPNCRGVLLDGMSRLGEVQRTVLMLRDAEGWSHQEVADQLGISETMSRRHLSDARKAMRAYLQHADLHD